MLASQIFGKTFTEKSFLTCKFQIVQPILMFDFYVKDVVTLIFAFSLIWETGYQDFLVSLMIVRPKGHDSWSHCIGKTVVSCFSVLVLLARSSIGLLLVDHHHSHHWKDSKFNVTNTSWEDNPK